MPTLVVRDDAGHERMMDALRNKRDYPYMCKIEKGEPRSLRQNRLYHKWMQELAEQDSDPSNDAAWYTAYCKYHFGLKILAAADIEYQEFFNNCLRPLPYETRLKAMYEPYGFPVTSEMNMKQMTQFLDEIQKSAAENGMILTQPESH